MKWRSTIMALLLLPNLTLITELKANAFQKSGTVQLAKQIPLDSVIEEVKGALSDYQTEVSTSNNPLPPLKSADFDFKTVIKRGVTGGFTILIFTFKGSREDQQTGDLQFHYEVPRPVHTSSYQPVPVRKALLDLIRVASQTIQSSTSSNALGNMKISNVSITVEYAVTSSISAEGKPIVQFVTLDLGGSYSKNEVQSIKLVFERKQ